MRHSPATSIARTHRALADARARLAAHDPEILRSQVALAEMPAPSGSEQTRASWIAARFHQLGLADVHIDSAGNAIGRRTPAASPRRDAPPVVVCAHLDTVFPLETDLRVRRDGTRYVGPGIHDNSRGLAVMLALADAIDSARVGLTHPVEFLASTGEEGAGDLRGAKHYFAARGANAAAMIALDGAGDERIVHRALGSRRFRVTYTGVGGHSWSSFGTPNAVHAAATMAARLAALALPAEPRTTLSVGRIGGGIAVNAIPQVGWLEVDLRSVDAAMLARYETEIRLAARAGADEENGRRTSGTPPLACTVEVIGDRPGGATAAEHPLVATAAEATWLVGREPDLAAASTDANVPISRGIPAITIGAGGRGGDAHTRTEWFENANAHRGIARALTIIVAAASGF